MLHIRLNWTELLGLGLDHLDDGAFDTPIWGENDVAGPVEWLPTTQCALVLGQAFRLLLAVDGDSVVAGHWHPIPPLA